MEKGGAALGYGGERGGRWGRVTEGGGGVVEGVKGWRGAGGRWFG